MQLRPPPSAEWEYAADTLLRDPWLARKVDRERRLREIEAYLVANCPELAEADPGLVVDLGPGPGEFLELCRSHGHSVLGIDAATGSGGMGDKYLAYSRLMAERQGVPVDYCGFAPWLDRDDTDRDGTVALVHSRGSIEQCFSGCMTGPPHHEHQDCRRLAWRVDRAGPLLDRFFIKCARLLRPGGHVLIHANGAANTDQYDILVRLAAEKSGLVLVHAEPPRLHKWMKP